MITSTIKYVYLNEVSWHHNYLAYRVIKPGRILGSTYVLGTFL